ILRFLPLNNIQSLSIDSDASSLQLTHWPYLSRLRTLRVDGFTINSEYTIAYIATLIENILFIRLPALRSLDLGMNNYGTCWPITTAVVPLTYLRIDLPRMDTLISLISTPPLCDTLRQLHVHIVNN
ncbi:unnamed protein product, partial [Rotaria sp. Silwood2]